MKKDIPETPLNANYTVILGMPVERALELWRQHGSLPIRLSQCENCLDLEKLLSRTDISNEHLEAVKAWIKEHNGT